jgi:glycosyl-4,4'-diaponeurosporenoate acyltransferase
MDTSFPLVWVILIDALAWLVIHLGVACLGMRIRPERFDPAGWLFRERRMERGGRLYERFFAVKLWKDFLPDGAALFQRGFRKKALLGRDREYFSRFVTETCRGEIVHWVVLCCSILFFLWNTWAVGLIMVAYAVAANLPCILAQRYNRLRFIRVMEHTPPGWRRDAGGPADKPVKGRKNG